MPLRMARFGATAEVPNPFGEGMAAKCDPSAVNLTPTGHNDTAANAPKFLLDDLYLLFYSNYCLYYMEKK